jgi:hypothetical protein
MPVHSKQIRERVAKMSSAWKQGAPTISFKGIKQSDFQTGIEAASSIEQEISSLEAQLKLKKNERDAAYQKLQDDSIKVRDGVEGNETYGTNHPLYEAMGFTLEANRKSGLTRKKKEPSGAKT